VEIAQALLKSTGADMDIKVITFTIAGLLPASFANAQTDAPPSAEAAIKTEIASAFARADADKDGSISRDEFGSFMEQAIAQQIKVFNQTFDTLDIDKDGRISKQEADENKAFATGFGEIDTDKDGFVSKEELAMAMKAAQDNQAKD
jgi:Ca2+-binding EF-hand superfamily protein